MSIYKRGYRRDTLTGGSKDVNPQWMTLSATQTAADTFTQVQTQIPIQRLQNAGRAQVMEVLKIIFMSGAFPVAGAAQNIMEYQAALTTKTFAAAVTWAEPTCFAIYNKSRTASFTAAGTGMEGFEFEPYTVDMTDGAGHGILIASDNIFLQVSSAATGQVNASQIKIIYRWKDVSIQEYVGIVQSQQ